MEPTQYCESSDEDMDDPISLIMSTSNPISSKGASPQAINRVNGKTKVSLYLNQSTNSESKETGDDYLEQCPDNPLNGLLYRQLAIEVVKCDSHIWFHRRLIESQKLNPKVSLALKLYLDKTDVRQDNIRIVGSTAMPPIPHIKEHGHSHKAPLEGRARPQSVGNFIVSDNSVLSKRSTLSNNAQIHPLKLKIKEILTIKEMSPKRLSQIDFKKNKGLVGMKILRQSISCPSEEITTTTKTKPENQTTLIENKAQLKTQECVKTSEKPGPKRTKAVALNKKNDMQLCQSDVKTYSNRSDKSKIQHINTKKPSDNIKVHKNPEDGGSIIQTGSKEAKKINQNNQLSKSYQNDEQKSAAISVNTEISQNIFQVRKDLANDVSKGPVANETSRTDTKVKTENEIKEEKRSFNEKPELFPTPKDLPHQQVSSQQAPAQVWPPQQAPAQVWPPQQASVQEWPPQQAPVQEWQPQQAPSRQAPCHPAPPTIPIESNIIPYYNNLNNTVAPFAYPQNGPVQSNNEQSGQNMNQIQQYTYNNALLPQTPSHQLPNPALTNSEMAQHHNQVEPNWQPYQHMDPYNQYQGVPIAGQYQVPDIQWGNPQYDVNANTHYQAGYQEYQQYNHIMAPPSTQADHNQLNVNNMYLPPQYVSNPLMQTPLQNSENMPARTQNHLNNINDATAVSQGNVPLNVHSAPHPPYPEQVTKSHIPPVPGTAVSAPSKFHSNGVMPCSQSSAIHTNTPKHSQYNKKYPQHSKGLELSRTKATPKRKKVVPRTNQNISRPSTCSHIPISNATITNWVNSQTSQCNVSENTSTTWSYVPISNATLSNWENSHNPTTNTVGQPSNQVNYTQMNANDNINPNYVWHVPTQIPPPMYGNPNNIISKVLDTGEIQKVNVVAIGKNLCGTNRSELLQKLREKLQARKLPKFGVIRKGPLGTLRASTNIQTALNSQAAGTNVDISSVGQKLAKLPTGDQIGLGRKGKAKADHKPHQAESVITGYSPSILPIPSMRKTYDILMNSQPLKFTQSPLSPATMEIMNKGGGAKRPVSHITIVHKKTAREKGEVAKNLKKISLEEYKKRSGNLEGRIIDLTDDKSMQNRPNLNNKMSTIAANNERRSVDSQDLGYGSDSTVLASI